MRVKRQLPFLVLVGFLVTWLPASGACAATATLSDVTDFITRLGGYSFPVSGPAGNNQIYWLQVSYKVTPPASSSNITTIVMTRFPMAAAYKLTGNGTTTPTQPSATTAVSTALNACEAQDYTIDTVTLDLRDIELVTPAATQSSDGGHAIWSVVLKTNGKSNFIRQNTQTLPANCYPAGTTPTANLAQADVSQYAIVFADPVQAAQFVRLLNNVIPTLNPPVLIGQ